MGSCQRDGLPLTWIESEGLELLELGGFTFDAGVEIGLEVGVRVEVGISHMCSLSKGSGKGVARLRIDLGRRHFEYLGMF